MIYMDNVYAAYPLPVDLIVSLSQTTSQSTASQLVRAYSMWWLIS